MGRRELPRAKVAANFAPGPWLVSGNVRATLAGGGERHWGLGGQGITAWLGEAMAPLGPKGFRRLGLGFEVRKSPLYRSGICLSPNPPTLQGKPGSQTPTQPQTRL